MIENPRTGEQIEFVSESEDLLVMRSTWTRPGHRAVEHVHPGMEERFDVTEGRAAFRVDGAEFDAGPGETVVVPAGASHLAWNPTDAEVRLTISMRPALRWAEFTTRLFAGEDPRVLLATYAEEITVPGGRG